jgi:voltage-gated potassium channel
MRPWFVRLKEIVERCDTRTGRLFDLFIQTLIVLSLITFSIETVPGNDVKTQTTLRAIEVFTVAVFTLEYFLRLLVADSRRRFVFSFAGIIDLLAILPFYVASGVDLRSIRVFRLFRLARILKLFRYSQALERLKVALRDIKEELVIFAAATLFVLYLSAVGIYYFENPAQPEKFTSVFTCLWWSVTSVTTVGYGDMYPITTGGRMFTFFVLVVGIGIVAVPTSLLAAALSKTPKVSTSNDA